MSSRKVSAHRRDFLKASAAVAGVAASTSFAGAFAAGNDVIKVGLIGCGGRGKGAVEDILQAERRINGTSPKLEIVAVGDTGIERRRRVHRRFVGLYRELNATARAEEPSVRIVTDEELSLVVAGTEQIVAEHLYRRDPAEVATLAPTVESVVSSLLLSPLTP